MKPIKISYALAFVLFVIFYNANAQTYKIVDTDQHEFYDNYNEVAEPSDGDAFYGQDANYNGHQPSYTDNGDGTVTDNVTGLMWAKTPDIDGDGNIDYDDKMSYNEALEAAGTFNLAGYNDWRVPSIKESYSLIMFSGIDPSGYEGSSTEGLIPFINTEYFDFGYGDMDAGERIIDAQFVSSTLYVGTTMGGAETMFGVNLADGRIKGYPKEPMPGQTEDKQFYVLFVRGNSEYGINDFEDNGDGTITDHATGLMWMQDDNGEAILWEEALDYAEGKIFAGYSDWRLPNAKELQSIVDYERAPAVTNSPAIDPLFNCSVITDEGELGNYPFYWSGTTHVNWGEMNGSAAAYVAFGEALGWMEMPPESGDFTLMDVHGAGAQRSDPKTGNPDDYPYGHGPQGDVIRIYNYVRLVRNIDGETGMLDRKRNDCVVSVYPNPARKQIKIFAESLEQVRGCITILDTTGETIKSIGTDDLSENLISIDFMPSGLYFLRIDSDQSRFSASFVKE